MSSFKGSGFVKIFWTRRIFIFLVMVSVGSAIDVKSLRLTATPTFKVIVKSFVRSDGRDFYLHTITHLLH